MDSPRSYQQSYRRRVTRTHPCVFKEPFLREQVDPRIKEMWPKAPFGNLRRLWRERHCATLNPYDSTYCPYRVEECALSFLLGVEATVIANPKDRTAYFRTVVHRSAMNRAENKPLARTQGSGHARGSGSRPEEGRGLRSEKTRPVTIADVLGTLDLGPRQGPPKDEPPRSE